MMFSGGPATITDIEDLDIVLQDINELEGEVNDNLVEDEILPASKVKLYKQQLDYIVETYHKLRDAEELDAFRGNNEQDRIEAGINTLKSIESKLQEALDESDRLRDLEESD
ncbi:hypothetical protein F4814DRAFT_445915 [Daldinia grandis]|nr:hypothetical protein F4814DRAFT_445915 [Daldinia grandis]